MSRVCKIILVCEGWRDSAFARGFLVAAGIDARSVDPKVNPRGSGHDWVKTQFAEESANLARFDEGRGVLGLLDEDGQGAAVREKEVADRLKERGLGSISAQDGGVFCCQREIAKPGSTGGTARGIPVRWRP